MRIKADIGLTERCSISGATMQPTAAPPHGRLSSRIDHTIEGRNSVPLTKNGMDVAIGLASNYNMGQSNSSARCEHCGGFMVLVLPVDGKGPGVVRCLECDQIDPLKLPSIAAWLVGELRPPR
jgi:hypothetical protein